MQIAQSWRLKGQRYALKGTKCEKCQRAIFPPREVCPYCASLEAKAVNDANAQPIAWPVQARMHGAER